jgi:hypothetical protein
MKKRAQAAIEFLTTYGWMLLAVAAVFGTMAYFGIGSIRDTLPLRCDFGFDFGCGATYANDEGRLVYQIQNTQSKGLYINRSICTFPNSDRRVLTSYSGLYLGPSEDIVLECDPDPLPETLVILDKQLFEVKVIFQYDEVGALPNVANGEVVVEIIEGPLPGAYTAALTSGSSSLLPES